MGQRLEKKTIIIKTGNIRKLDFGKKLDFGFWENQTNPNP